ncbi:hypothetical protein H310_12651 [Aphanomyces invadans]|uniref:WW domain-containing protein n=1 Tax=Aphanomyces invadans TaxID=157072 RepID=A0A024TIL4_9STRA|nr:hypothetical protein H310_12651 [Aphanomyces invadans]ETV93406.1 hypothetical protein H310_12651 [Aphanomyces invadans]|eukprot:XP_008878042.1 hypothetical protein H310_12651 [Aphanomyces invadans]
MSDSDVNAGTEAVAHDEDNEPYEVLYEGMVKRKSGAGRTLKPCLLRIYADGVVVDLGVQREYALLDVAEWQIDRKKIKDATLTDAGLRVDCRGDEDRVVTLWLVLPSDQERHKWKVFLMAALHPNSKEGQRVRQLVAQQRQQEKIRIAEIERTRDAMAQAQKPLKKKTPGVAMKSTRALLAPASPAPNHASGWQKFTSDDGQEYYYNAITQESRWTLLGAGPLPRSKSGSKARLDQTGDRRPRSSKKRADGTRRKKADDTQPRPVVEASSSGSDDVSKPDDRAIKPTVEDVVDPAFARLETSRRMLVEATDAPDKQGSCQEEDGPGKHSDVANALEMMLGRGRPKPTTTGSTQGDDVGPVIPGVDHLTLDDPNFTTAERLRMKRQQRQHQMVTADDETDLFLHTLAAKAKQKNARTTTVEDAAAPGNPDPFQFPLDAWLDVEQEILFEPSPSPTHNGSSMTTVGHVRLDEKGTRKKKSKPKSTRAAAPRRPPQAPPTTPPSQTNVSSEDKAMARVVAPKAIHAMSQHGKKPTKAGRAADAAAAMTSKRNPPPKRIHILSDSTDSDSAPSRAATPRAVEDSSAATSAQSAVDWSRPRAGPGAASGHHNAPSSTWTAPDDGKEYDSNSSTQTSVWDKPIEWTAQQHVPVDALSLVHERTTSHELPTTTTLAAAIALLPPHIKIDPTICPHCHAARPTQRCVDCESIFCDACCATHHRRYGSMVNHTIALLSAPYCHSCQASSATQTCVECRVHLCDACASFLHRKRPKHLHKRVPVSQHTAAPPLAIQDGGIPMHQTHAEPMVVVSPPQALLYQPQRQPFHARDTAAVSPGGRHGVTTAVVVAAGPSAPSMAVPHMPRCATCGGWGVDFIAPSRRTCDHCDRLATFQPQLKLGDIDWDEGDEEDGGDTARASSSSSSSGWE